VNSRRVLLVEDDTGIHGILRQFFELEGFEVYSAFNGQEALEHLEQQKLIHLILLDLMMPIMSGYEFLEKIQQEERYQKFSHIPTVLASASADVEKTAATHSKLFIKKPIDLMTLLKVIPPANELSS
jgi:CheY-like chemotaxis protein